MHPHSDELQSLLENLHTAGRARTLAHVLGCPSCLRRFLSVLRRREAGDPLLAKVLRFRPRPSPRNLSNAPAWGPFLDRALSAAAREQGEARGLFEELAAQPEERWPLFLRNRPGIATLGVAQRALSASAEAVFSDAREAERLARLSLQVLDATDVAAYGRRTIDDFRARAWAFIGNARRTVLELAGAERALDRALRFLRESWDPAEKALVCNMMASLRRDQRRFGEARLLVLESRHLYRSIQDDESIAVTLLEEGLLWSEAGEMQRARRLLERAMTAIDPLADPRSAFCTHHALAICWLDLGHIAAARRSHAEAQRFQPTVQERPIELRVRWVRGLLASVSGERAEAESLLQGVWVAYLEAGIPYLAALAAFDLADHYARTGQSRRQLHVANAAAGIFFSLGRTPEALAALAIREGRPRRPASSTGSA